MPSGLFATGVDPPSEDAGFLGYVFFCLFGVLFFVHGLATFCAGLTSPKASLSQLSYSMVVSSVVTVQFYAVGFSLQLSSPEDAANGSWSGFIGDFHQTFLRNVDYDSPAAIGQILLVYAFSVVPACLLASAACQRGRFVPLLVFVFVWMTLVYSPVAHWCWHQNGWSYKLGVLDYAGGTIIHITAGFAALVYSLVLAPRLSYATNREDPSYSLPMVISGTAQMLFGWIGFTGASQTRDPVGALLGVFNTLLSAAMGGLSWMALDYFVGLQRNSNFLQSNTEDQPLSLVSFCSGVISGLVAITPGAGYVPSWAAMLFGICGGIGCNFGTKIKFYLGVDDPLDVFAVHGIGGLVGTLLTGVFALDDFKKPWQFWLQLISGLTTAAYTVGCTFMIAVAIDSVPALRMRIDPQLESRGIDSVEHGETAATGVSTVDSARYVGANQMGSGTNMMDLTRLRQTNVNTSMHFGAFDQPLLQRLPLSYGTYTRQNQEPEEL